MTKGNGLPTGIWDEKGDYILEQRRLGASLRMIAPEVGVSAERIRQLLEKRFGTTELRLTYSTFEIAELTGLSPVTVWKRVKEGVIKPVLDSMKAQGRGMFFEADVIVTLMRYCPICGNPVMRYKAIKYCSPECSVKGEKESRQRTSWRHYHQKIGQKITPRFARQTNRHGVNRAAFQF